MKINSKRIVAFFIAFVLLFLPLESLAFYDDDYVWDSFTQTNANTEENTSKPEENSLNLQSGAAILIDQSTGQVLYEHNSHEQLRPASVTKVMTILLIMEALDRGDINRERVILQKRMEAEELRDTIASRIK